MVSEFQIRPATIQDVALVSNILNEAASWLERSGMPLWQRDELRSGHIVEDVRAGLFFIAEYMNNSAGTFRFQLDDPIFWPDAPEPDAAYIHRLAVRRRYAGAGLSTEILRWAADRTRELGRRCLRLDCPASRPRLRSVYERFGFRRHSDRQVGPYLVARYEYDVTRLQT
jgi:GNAT superfamily N-acetyltransferase